MIAYKKNRPIEPVVDFLTERLTQKLQEGKRVLWLVAGGSCAPLAVAVANRLQGEEVQLLTVTLTDERYGQPGHADSNWQQLLAAGFVLPGARLQPVLSGESREATVRAFDKTLRHEFAEADYRIGLFGMGPDGHTAGLFPGSQALESQAFAVDFQGSDFERITMTTEAVKQLDEAVLYAVGAAKHTALSNLEKELQLEQQPAQILKSVPALTIFNDYKGEVVQ